MQKDGMKGHEEGQKAAVAAAQEGRQGQKGEKERQGQEGEKERQGQEGEKERQGQEGEKERQGQEGEKERQGQEGREGEKGGQGREEQTGKKGREGGLTDTEVRGLADEKKAGKEKAGKEKADEEKADEEKASGDGTGGKGGVTEKEGAPSDSDVEEVEEESGAERLIGAMEAGVAEGKEVGALAVDAAPRVAEIKEAKDRRWDRSEIRGMWEFASILDFFRVIIRVHASQA
ncbi:unnamed protein product [Closterium sp. Naga37s-1]|nr:unnamed protein product [Closterium sp. Naga37s-1]